MMIKPDRINWQREALGMQVARWAYLSILVIVLSVSLIPVLKAETITWENMDQRIAEAKTAADHEAISDFYKAQATLAAAQVKYHENMMKSYGAYKKVPARPANWMSNHCENLIKVYGEAQAEYENMAKEHAQMAKELSGQR